MKYFTAKACGQWLPLLSITLQDCTSFRHLTVPFRSLSAPSLGYPRKSASFIPLHSGQPAVSFCSPLAFPPHIPELSQNGKLHSTQPNSLHCIQSPPLLFPMPTRGMSCEVLTPEPQKPQKPHRPLMVQVKIKDHSRIAFVLAAGSSHSFNRSL